MFSAVPDANHPPDAALPPRFAGWFQRRGWRAHPHQLTLLSIARAGNSALLVAPTGAGKTLAGFLPSLADLAEYPAVTPTLHTLYISPLKALAADIARNLTGPALELELGIRIETRTGDTATAERRRQREAPPDLLLTTPESLALLLSQPDARQFFGSLKAVVIDEIHALIGTKRGDQLALCLARLSSLAPAHRRIGLSATVRAPSALLAYLSLQGRADDPNVHLVQAPDGADPDVSVLLPEGRLPWSGHMGLMAAPEIYQRIEQAGITIVFVNTRAQAELIFQELWRHNDAGLPIGLHHGSLALEQRRKVEAAMAAGALRAVVATSSLDLGIDWGSVDLVIQVGAPKGVARLLQRIGRANHRWNEPSRAVLVPANRFEVLECRVAVSAVAAREIDGEAPPPGGLDVLAQHLLGTACGAPFHPDAMFEEVRRASPYASLARRDFDDVLRFVEDGGYALSSYERWRKLFRDAQGVVHVVNERIARQHRMNIGTIVEAPLLKVRLGRGMGGATLGEIEEYFVSLLSPGDTFLFAGRLLRFERLHDTVVECSPGGTGEPKVPAYAGGRMPLSTHLADGVRRMLENPEHWRELPDEVREWLSLQADRSVLPRHDNLLVETFPRGGRWYLVAYCFEGRNAHQTLGMLLSRRMERLGFAPLGFVATDYVLAVWSSHEPDGIDRLFEEDLLGDDLDAWMAGSSMHRRTFRNVAVIAGLIERQMPGSERSRRQVTINTDLIYDVLRKHEPDHILLRATLADAARGMIDVGRIALLLRRAKGRLVHVRLDRVSPLAVPVLLEQGREGVASRDGEETLLAEAEAESLIADATGSAPAPGTLRVGGRHSPDGSATTVHPLHRANMSKRSGAGHPGLTDRGTRRPRTRAS